MQKLAGPFLCAALAAWMVGAAVSGCITTRHADGSSESRVDVQTAIALTQAALDAAEDGFKLWQAMHPTASTFEVASEQARQRAREQALQHVIEALGRKLAAAPL